MITASLVGLAACDSDDSDPAPIDPPAPSTTLQELHASPDAPAVVVDGAEVLSDLDYKVSSGRLELDAGTYSVDVRFDRYDPGLAGQPHPARQRWRR